MKLKFAFAFLVSIFCVNTAFATTYYVAASGGSNTNSCGSAAASVTTAKATINAGITCMSAGDTVSVRAGTYHEGINFSIPSGSSNSARSIIRGYPGDARPVMNGSLTLALNNNITWDGINIDGTGGNDTEDCVLINSGSNITITNAELVNCQRHGVDTGDGNGALLSNLLFSYLTVHNTGQGYLTSPDPRHHNFYIAASHFTTGPITIDHVESYNTGNPANAASGGPSGSAANSWGIQIYAAVSGFINQVTISNCYIHDNNQGIILGSGSNYTVYNNIIYNNDLPTSFGEAAITIGYNAGNNIQVYNNTIVHNQFAGAYGISVGHFGGPTGAIIKNNILWDNGTDSIELFGGTGTVTSNNFMGTNPIFVNSSSDFHLQSSSPALDYGTNLFSVFTTDYDGVARPSSAAWEPGAYEFNGGGGGGGGGGTIRYLSASGSDSNSCSASTSISTPKATFGSAVACMSAGDTLYVRSGTYTESLNNNEIPAGSGFPTGATTIRKYAGDSTPILSGNVWISTHDNIIWDGIDINGNGDPADGAAESTTNFFVNGGQHILITNTNLYNCQHNCLLFYDGNGTIGDITFSFGNIHDGSIGSDATFPYDGVNIHADTTTTGAITLDNVSVYNINCAAATGGGFPYCWAIQLTSSAVKLSTFTLSNSYIHDNHQGVRVGDGADALVYNTIFYNTVSSNSQCQAALVIGGSNSNSRSYNNTFNSNIGGSCGTPYAMAVGGSSTGAIIKNNIFYANGHDSVSDAGSGTTQSNNFTSDPLFVNPGAGNFHLQGTSTAAGTGANLTGTFTTDKDGATRPGVGAWDPGPYVVVVTGGGGGGTPPATPLNLSIPITISWTASTTTVRLAGYNVYRSTTSGVLGSLLNGSIPVVDTTYTDTTAVVGTTYYYTVKSVNTTRVESAASNQVAVTR